MPAVFFVALALLAFLLGAASLPAEQVTPKGLVLRATPQMKVVPKRGKRSAFVPPVRGVDGTLVFAEWADMQPTKFGPLSQNNVIDQALAAVKEWNQQHPEHAVYLRLRTFAGIYSPDWVMEHTGAVEVDYRKKVSAKPLVRMTPRFWTAEFAEAWTDYQIKMAKKYDGHPLISDVSISGCMTLHSEVMWRQPGFPFVLPTLMQAGLTREADLACLKQDISRFMRVWKNTPVEMTLNTRRQYHLVDPAGGGDTRQPTLKAGNPDVAFGKELLAHLRQESRRYQCPYMIGNHSLSEYSALDHDKAKDPRHIFFSLHQEHKKHHTPLYFQTEVFTAARAEELIQAGIDIGASLIELSNDMSPQQILQPEIQSLRKQLKQAD